MDRGGEIDHSFTRPTLVPDGPSTSTQDNAPLVNKKTKSTIWTHFTLVSVVTKDNPKCKSSAKCKYCNKTIRTEYSNTSGMRRHLQSKHYSKYLELEKEEQRLKQLKDATETDKICPTIASKQAKLTDFNKWKNTDPRAVALTKEIGKWMAASLHPYTLADELGLKRVLNLAQPNYNLPSSKTFSRRIIPNLFEDVKDKMKRLIQNKQSVLVSTSITLDLWTSKANNSFLAVTNHFLDDEFNMNNMCLGCYSYPGEHTGQSISDKLKDCVDEWGLRDLNIPIYTVTDNASNMKSAMALSSSFVSPISCFAHTLQLALKDAKTQTQGMSELVAKVRKLVGHYKHSTRATERLHDVQKSLGLDETQLIQDCETRWNSEYLMLERLIRNKEALSRDIGQTGHLDNLTVAEWKLIQGYVDILQPLYQATVEVCSSTVPTCSMVIPILHCVETTLESYKEEERGKGKMFAANLLKSLLSRFPGKMKKDPYLSAMLVDPRFKDIVLQDAESKMGLSKLKVHIARLSKVDLTEEITTEPAGQTQDTLGEKKSLWDIFKKAAATKAQSTSNLHPTESAEDVELKTFFREPCIQNSEDPCSWWRENGARFPLLKNVAKQFLAIPATEVASERTFSSAGNVCTELRERLTSEHVEELVFLHQNSKFYF